MSFSGGSAQICLTEHFRSCMEAIHHLWSLSSVLCRKVLFWVRVCLSYTRQTLLMWLRHTTLRSIRMQLTVISAVSTQGHTTAIQRLEICISDVCHLNRLKLNADKTELLWAGSKYASASLNGSGLPLRLGHETIIASDHVRLLGVTITSNLSTDKHVSNISSSCFLLAS